MSNKVIFNNSPLPSFLDLIKIDYPILPEFENVNGVFTPKERKIALELAFNKRGLISKQQETELIQWVKGNNFDYSPLVLYNDKDTFYKAKLESPIQSDGIKRAKMNINFICKPYKYSIHEYKCDIRETTKILYKGDGAVMPTITFEVTSACQEILLNITNAKGISNYIKILGEFNSKDIIVIDQVKNRATVNNLVRMGVWALDSKRHKLEYGENTYEVKKGNVNTHITYKELYY